MIIMKNIKIKFFSTFCKKFEDVEKEVNDFCGCVDVIDIKIYDTRIMVLYVEG